jgi:hypothetical protein
MAGHYPGQKWHSLGWPLNAGWLFQALDENIITQRCMKIEIKLSEWYAKGHVDTQSYDPFLENGNGMKCCLGFCALGHGAKHIVGKEIPKHVWNQLPVNNWMLSDGPENSPLAMEAMDINDASQEWEDQPIEVRMGNLITIFAEGGDELVFVP